MSDIGIQCDLITFDNSDLKSKELPSLVNNGSDSWHIDTSKDNQLDISYDPLTSEDISEFMDEYVCIKIKIIISFAFIEI